MSWRKARRLKTVIGGRTLSHHYIVPQDRILDLIVTTLLDGHPKHRAEDTFMENIVNVFASTILVDVDNNINNKLDLNLIILLLQIIRIIS